MNEPYYVYSQTKEKQVSFSLHTRTHKLLLRVAELGRVG